MSKYRKKPIIIDAFPYQYGCYGQDGYDEANTPELIRLARLWYEAGVGMQHFDGSLDVVVPYLNTLEGKHYISPGDYIITGIKGERYPCKSDIFEATYELVKEIE